MMPSELESKILRRANFTHESMFLPAVTWSPSVLWLWPFAPPDGILISFLSGCCKSLYPLLPPHLQCFLQLFWPQIWFSFNLSYYPAVLLRQHVSCRYKTKAIKGVFLRQLPLFANLHCLKGQVISSKQTCSQ